MFQAGLGRESLCYHPRPQDNEGQITMTRRLGLVVPYRDRKENLDEFIPFMREFFAEPDQRDIACEILIVEQAPGLPFNRGAIKNIGYQYLAPTIDYVCFHDVDLLPLAADYHGPLMPTMVCFHGLDFTSDFVRLLFGGVVLLQNAQFEAANGYSNAYWQWGYEDVDLRERLLRRHLKPEHREGRFRKLPHVDEGSLPGNVPTTAHLKSKQQYLDQWFEPLGQGWRRLPNPTGLWQAEGLNALRFEEVTPRHTLMPQQDHRPSVSRVVVAPAPPDYGRGEGG